MAISMTGIGKGQIKQDGYNIAVFVRSVNHRYLHINIRSPKEYQQYEGRIRARIGQKISRGKLDLSLEVYTQPVETKDLVINEELMSQLVNYSRKQAEKLEIPTGMTIEKLFQFQGVFNQIPKSLDDDITWQICSEALDIALDELIEERCIEGENLTVTLLRMCGATAEKIQQIKILAKNQSNAIKKELLISVEKIKGEIKINEDRLEQEVIFAARRSDITEELDRLISHVKRLKEVLNRKESIGKKCEFILQEIHREVNTIASKSADKLISNGVVDIKVEVERMREQIQNIE